MYSQIQRASLMNNERRVIIDEVNPSASVITGKDSYGKVFQVAFDFKDTLLAIPQQGQMWIISQYNNEWRLERKLDTGNETTPSTEMNPGDYRVEADATLYLNGGTVLVNADSVLVNSRDILAELDANEQENVDQDTTLTTLQQEITDLGTNINSVITTDLATINGEILTINNEIVGIDDHLTILDGQVATTNTNVTNLNNTVNTDVLTINGQISGISDQISSINTQLITVNTNAADVPHGTGGAANTVPIWNGTAYNQAQISNAQIAAAAAIAYTKLSLAGQIVNNDIATAASIAYSKLNLANSVKDADIAAAAAISLNKLAGYPNDSSKYPRGDGTWATLVTASPVVTFTNLVDVTTTSETDLFGTNGSGWTIPANTLGATDRLEISGVGDFNVASGVNPNQQWKVYLGGTVIIATPSANLINGQGSPHPFSFLIRLSMRGATNSVFAELFWELSNPGAANGLTTGWGALGAESPASGGGRWYLSSAGDLTVDMTAAQAIRHTFTTDVAGSGGTEIRIRQTKALKS